MKNTHRGLFVFFQILLGVCSAAEHKVALITGITGQDGSYLAELLLSKDYIVHGIVRRSSTINTERIDHIYEPPQKQAKRLFLHYGDLTDAGNLTNLVIKIQPDEIYNLGAQSHVKTSFEIPVYTADVVALGTLRLLEAIRTAGLEKTVRFYQASSSELYGDVLEDVQNENTIFNPRSPYAISKHFAYSMVNHYRQAYGIYACNGILFNHESPRRGKTFVTKKISEAVARISLGLQDCLYLGNLDAKRDWGHAKDYVEGMWRLLQQDKPRDIVLATNETHTVREFAEKAFMQVGSVIEWKGSGEGEIGVNQHGKVCIRIDPKYFRPTDVELLLGDPSRAKAELGWTPRITFAKLVEEMVAADLEETKRYAVGV